MNSNTNDNESPKPTKPELDNDRAAFSFPPFDDPAFSSRRAGSPVKQSAPIRPAPPKDTQYAGHPDFSQDAANNTPPADIGNSEEVNDVNEKTHHSDGHDRPLR
jgi:hypothetical protein